jgi:hypothetical protein
MAADQLKQLLEDSATDLNRIVARFNSISPSSLHSDCQDKIKEFDLMGKQLNATCNLIEPREHARNSLYQLQLPSVTDPDTGMTSYCGITIPFSHARILLFQSYLSMTWAICDLITAAISPLVCTQGTCLNRANPPQLLTHFVKDDKYSVYYSSLFLKLNYGWAIGISYVIRNHFFHDGALSSGKDFFAGINVADGFDISRNGWNFLEKELLEKHKLKQDYHRLSTLIWPWYPNDLLKLLELCNQEIDEALIFLVSWSVGMATSQVESLLIRDSNNT